VAKGKTKQGYFCYPVTLQKCCVPALVRGGGRNENQGLRAPARRSKISRGGGRRGNIFMPGSLRSPDGFVRSERDTDCTHHLQWGRAEPEHDVRVPSEHLALLVTASPSVSLCQLSSLQNPSWGPVVFCFPPSCGVSLAATPARGGSNPSLVAAQSRAPVRSRAPTAASPGPPSAQGRGEPVLGSRDAESSPAARANYFSYLFHLLFTSSVLAGGVSSARRLCQCLSPLLLPRGAVGGGHPCASPRAARRPRATGERESVCVCL